MATAHLIADRLTFHWSADPADRSRLRCEVVERRPRAGDRVTGYGVEPDGDGLLFTKDDPADPETYRVSAWGCTCAGATCRFQQLRCRHQRAVIELARQLKGEDTSGD